MYVSPVLPSHSNPICCRCWNVYLLLIQTKADPYVSLSRSRSLLVTLGRWNTSTKDLKLSWIHRSHPNLPWLEISNSEAIPTYFRGEYVEVAFHLRNFQGMLSKHRVSSKWYILSPAPLNPTWSQSSSGICRWLECPTMMSKPVVRSPYPPSSLKPAINKREENGYQTKVSLGILMGSFCHEQRGRIWKWLWLLSLTFRFLDAKFTIQRRSWDVSCRKDREHCDWEFDIWDEGGKNVIPNSSPSCDT